MELVYIIAILLVLLSLFFGIKLIKKYKETKKKSYLIFGIFLIIIMLIVVAWTILRIFIESNVEIERNIEPKCLATEVQTTSVTKINDTSYAVTLTRKTGEDTIGGVKLVFTNSSEQENAIRDRAGDIGRLGTVEYTATILPTELLNPNKVAVVVYYLDDSGIQQLCQTHSEFKF
jgi:hypothetical protein